MSVLAVFDVRGIQEFIFRTNKIKEIIGASIIVKDMLMTCFKEACEKYYVNDISFDWQNKEYKGNLDMEVIFEGGGNLVAEFKDIEKYRQVYRNMTEEILAKTYSLSIASAYVQKTGNYYKDKNDLNKKLAELKRKYYSFALPRGIATTKRDYLTGLPISEMYPDKSKEYELVSREAKLKLKACDHLKLKKDNKFNYMLNLDDMVLEKGKDSLLAIVHIDGNNMADAINSRMNNKTDYKDAVETIRKLSQQITNIFTEDAYDILPKALEDAFNSLSGDLKKYCEQKEIRLPMRQIICAGDDITFICNARIAIPLTEMYLRKIIEYKDDNKEELEFSACAGIAFIHSHFPFSLAYEIAEECCSNAKAEAKSKNDKKRGFIDFHFCYSGVSGDLEQIRESQYINHDGYSLLRRPWQVTGKEIDAFKDIRMLKDFAMFFSTGKYENKEKKVDFPECCEQSETFKAWPNSRVKEFRNAHFSGEKELEDIYSQYKSRGYILPWYSGVFFTKNYSSVDSQDETSCIKGSQPRNGDYKDNSAENDIPIDYKAIYYDSLEMSDIYCDINEFAEIFITQRVGENK